MSLARYLANRPRGFKAEFAKKLGISNSFLSQIESGRAKMPLRLAKHISVFTEGQVTKAEIRPDVWEES